MGDSLPRERYGQMSGKNLVNELFPKDGAPSVLDVGCGHAKSKPMFLDRNAGTDWNGIEIAESYNVADLNNLPEGVKIYDGVNIPFPDKHFDFVFSNQVFEHVRHPEDLLKEIRRVLKDDGIFFGSLSGGEPYHWHSLFHFSALGWKTVLQDNGFRLDALYAGTDALSLLLHHWSANRKQLGPYFRLSILNELLSREKKQSEKAVLYENAIKLAFAGHLVFRATKS
ncbi:class I SAM-dependent methyltransferase [Pelagovum pacificum]|uniref:Class I SAM-dependent methyltransferase n=2 Tax=Pelagovum pacificum TaxID=2588711 RepID=A0A5C5GJI3_9RHOB|nr:class I SAM-dependent methyltransferase [Pelagovum pacificum]